MPRGRQYYDPILQVDSTVEGAPDLSRIEMFPAGPESESRLPQDIGKWIGRRINPDGSIAEEASGDFDYERALHQAQDLWPGLTVYELRAENEDSTWDGSGPSPRLWQKMAKMSVPPEFRNSAPETRVGHPPETLPSGPSSKAVTSEAGAELHALQVTQPGMYLRLEDILTLLEEYAAQFDQENNPSAALGLREAAQALREPF